MAREGAARGVTVWGTAPGRDLEVGVAGRGPTMARGIGSAVLAGLGGCAWSSGFWIGRLPRGLPPRGSREGITGQGDEPRP